MRIRSAAAWSVLGTLLGMGCGDAEQGGPHASLSMSLNLPSGLAITSLKLTVFDQNGSCSAEGDADGNPLTDLADLDLVLGQPRTITVSPGRRTFSVIAFD